MKKQINMTDSRDDLDRFASRKELEEFLEGFDGIELMHLEDDPRNLIPSELVVGYHMSFPEYWMDFWRGDRKRYTAEYDTLEKAAANYGGTGPEALIRRLRREYENARRCRAEYMVLHVSDAGAFEEITGRYHYTDREVIRELCDLVGEALPDDPEGPLLLLENLWQPGLTFTDPEMTGLLMDGIRYPWKGIMLDTGHLLHTNPELQSQEEGVAYIHQQLDKHGSLCRFIRGVHLHQSLTGNIMQQYAKSPPQPLPTWEERMGQLFDYVFQVDLHRPFTADGVKEMVERITPEYLTFEFITRNLPEHRHFLEQQKRVLE